MAVSMSDIMQISRCCSLLHKYKLYCHFLFEVIYYLSPENSFLLKKPSLYKGVLVLEKFNFIHGLSFISPLLFGQQLLINQFNGWKNNIVNFKPKTHLEEGISSRHGSDWYQREKWYKYRCLLENSLLFQSNISKAPCFLKSYGV